MLYFLYQNYSGPSEVRWHWHPYMSSLDGGSICSPPILDMKLPSNDIEPLNQLESTPSTLHDDWLVTGAAVTGS